MSTTLASMAHDSGSANRSYQTLLIEHGDIEPGDIEPGDIEPGGGVTTVTVNRPNALNALSQLVLTELSEFLGSVMVQSAAIRGLVLTGAGERAFIAGADIREMASMSPDEGEEFGRLGQEVTRLLEAIPVPVIACVNGYALGGGCEIAMGCDYIYCTDNAVFGQPEVSLGLIPGFGGCVRLQRLVGPARAKEMIYTGRRISAAEAHRIGLVNRVFASPQQMIEAARESLQEAASRSPEAIAICKKVINAVSGEPTRAGLEIERAAFRQAFTTQDMREGTRAFLDKRRPAFTGHGDLGQDNARRAIAGLDKAEN